MCQTSFKGFSRIRIEFPVTTLHMYLSCKIIIKKNGSEEVTNFKARSIALSCALKMTVT
jgi:hypothetical protein